MCDKDETTNQCIDDVCVNVSQVSSQGIVCNEYNNKTRTTTERSLEATKNGG